MGRHTGSATCMVSRACPHLLRYSTTVVRQGCKVELAGPNTVVRPLLAQPSSWYGPLSLVRKMSVFESTCRPQPRNGSKKRTAHGGNPISVNKLCYTVARALISQVSSYGGDPFHTKSPFTRSFHFVGS